MKQLHPRAVWLFFISSLIRIFFFYVFVGLWLTANILGDEGFVVDFIGWLILIGLVLITIAFIWAKLSYRYYRYELREDGFRKESGVIAKRYVTIPYDRIQNVDIYRDLLSRILGLSDLQIQTAGASAQITRSGIIGAGAEGHLPALSFEDAEKLRDELIRRAKNSKNQGL